MDDSKEDIEILEELIEEYKDCSVEGVDMQVDVSFREKQCNAIENLIAGYKQLEEENRIYGLEGCRVRLKMYIDENYIPTSLVKEKIEELKEIADEDNKDEYIKIQVLQELLGEE